MRRAVLTVAFALTVVLVARPAAAQPAPAPLAVAGVELGAHPQVTATVTAPVDLLGVPLAAGQVTLLEGGRAVPATITAEPVDGLEVVLVVDTSGSMQGEPIAAARAAASTFLDLLPAPVRAGVVGFGATATVASPIDADRSAAHAAVDGLGASGETSLYDAVELATSLFTPGTRRSIVVLSDGGDTASTRTLDDARAAVAAAGAHLDVAELVTTERDGAALAALAAAGGGRVMPATEPASLGAIYGDLASSLVSRYQVRWQAEASGPTTVALTVTAGGTVATASWQVDLPAPPAPAASTTTAVVTVADPVSRPAAAATSASPWLLVGGATATFAAIALVAGRALADRAERVGRSRLGPARRATTSASALAHLAERVSDAADRALEERHRRGVLAELVEAAGLALRPGEVVVLGASAAITAGGLGALLGGPVLALVLATLAVVGAVAGLHVAATRRRARFAADLGDTLQLLGGTLRSGYALLQAIDAVAREAESPTAEEFRRVVVEARLGRDLTESLHGLAVRMRSEDWEWVVQAMDINRDVGGDLAEVLDNVATTIRDRGQLRRQVQALSAEGRVSAYVLIGLPFVLYGALRLMNPGYVHELHHGLGLVAVAVGLVGLGIGAVWLRKLCQIVT